jgi:hypothetical protein
MSGYSDQYKDPRWQKKRLEILERDGFTCCRCGDKDSQLHVHHIRYIRGKKVWDYDNKMLLTLCSDCHEVTHLFMDHFNESMDDAVISTIKNGESMDLHCIIELSSGIQTASNCIGYRKTVNLITSMLDAISDSNYNGFQNKGDGNG